MGSGADCDAQYLFSADILGESKDFLPRHAKRYKTFFNEYERLHEERVNAYKDYITDVEDKLFADKQYSVSIKDDVLNALINSIENK